MWRHRIVFQPIVIRSFEVDVQGKEREVYSIISLPTEIGGNKAYPHATSRPLTIPIKQPRANHSRLPVSRLRRK